jgi:hypothetical protein
MVAEHVHYTVNSPKNVIYNGVLCNSDCQDCTLMKSKVQALEKEVKSMTEIINILKDELKFNCAYTED